MTYEPLWNARRTARLRLRLTPNLFERWASQTALDLHMTQPDLKEVEQRAATDFDGEATACA